MWFTVLEKMDTPKELIHRLLWGFFPDLQKAGAERPFCYKDTGDQILMLSTVEPNTDSKKIEFAKGQTVMFWMCASYNRRLTAKDGGYKRGVRFVTQPGELQAWLQRRLGDTATVNYVDVKQLAPETVVRKGGQKMTWPQTRLIGTLTVTSPVEFAALVGRGIGAGCAFGLGAMIMPEAMK